MKSWFYVVLFIALAMICWGVYAPVLSLGAEAMGKSSLRPFIGVGLAYFAIAVVVPILLLKSVGETGKWTASGVLWSLVAGAAGAIGALGVILALKSHGRPVYVMPLVFGGAPVVNSFLTIYLARTYKQVKPIFLAGLIVVVVGAVTVLLFRPHPVVTAAQPAPVLSYSDLAKVIVFTLLTTISWGVYGPTLHKGQMAMAGSRLRPFLCVGLAYFLIAVVVPAILLPVLNEPGQFTFGGMIWSLIGGATGAVGAIGIIMAFNFGGKPVYVMPLVFGGAPVINTFCSLAQTGGLDQIGPFFTAGLILVVIGAVTVLVFAPRGPTHGATPASASTGAPKEPPKKLAEGKTP